MLKDCHLLIGYVLLVLGLSEATYSPGYEYVQGVGWLRLHIVPATWPDAQLRCHLEDATLTAPTTSAITAVMKKTMVAHRLAESSVFTDIYASNLKGDYTNINELSVSSITLQWAVGEPNNLGNEEDCLVMTGAGELADVSCFSVHPFFCLKRNTTSTCDECNNTYIANECNSTLEANQSNTTYNENECNCTIEVNQCDTSHKVNECNSTIIILNECNNTLEADQCNTTHNENECNCTIEANQCNTTQEANSCDTTAEDYTLDRRTGSCYKFHRKALSWHRSAMACTAEHAHLAVINSDKEAQVLQEIFAENTRDTIIGSPFPDFVHLGFWDWNAESEWLTVFGETLTEAGYAKQLSNVPSYHCGDFSRTGELAVGQCWTMLAFICETNVK